MPRSKRRATAVQSTANLMVSVCDGTRQPISKDLNLLTRIIDGNQKQWFADYRKGPDLAFRNVPTFDNFGDNYTVLVWAEGYIQSGFTPVKVARGAWRYAELMLIPKESSFNFAPARWDLLRETHPALSRLLAHGAPSEVDAKERYEELMEDDAPTLAAFLNIATAMAEVQLPSGSALDYLKELEWEEMKQDRFFAYADPILIDQVERATNQGTFAPEIGSGFFHPEATRSYKEVRFGEANIQLTFHEGDIKTIDGVSCVKVEPDIDYYKDLGAHALLEVLPNTISGKLTDPRQVYFLRWMAGRMAGVPEFNPPYTLV